MPSSPLFHQNTTNKRMKNLLLLLLSGVMVTAQAQSDNKVVIGKIDTVYSTILGEKRQVWIYTPGMTSSNPVTNQRYPVLYLLDGDAHFPSVAGLVQQLSQVNGNTVLPEMIVVGIPNTDRTRDLTPTHVTSDPPAMDSIMSKSSGGGQNFLAFIEKELMPHIDSVYPAAPYKVLVGHSFGGLTVIDALTNHPGLFNAYIAIDPSMWYDHQRFLADTKKKLSANKFDGTKLFVGIANTMPGGMTVQQMKKDTAAETRHIRSIFELDKFIKGNRQNGLRYVSKYYNDDNHGSVPLISEYDGLRYIFNFYRMNITGKDFTDASPALVDKFRNHYSKVSKEMSFKVVPPEAFINYLGYDAMSKKHFTRAAAFFAMNKDNYPTSSNVYDSYADVLAAQKDTVNAIVNYNKALALQFNADTKRKLNLLEGKPNFMLTEQELQQYSGVFDIEGFPVAVTFYIKDGALWASVPGDMDEEMVPLASDTFALKNKNGYNIHFDMEDHKAASFTSVQPNGTFKGHLRKQ
jgi:uncharacterized protein